MKNSVSGAPKSRFVPTAWGAGALASVVMVLGVNGTLSSWTQAVINNDKNHTQSAVAVALEESSGGTSCVDTAVKDGNTATCSTINKYGSDVLDPDAPSSTPTTDTNTSATTVTLTNTGTADGILKVAAAACATTVAGSAIGATPDVCAQLTVAVSCVDRQTQPVTTTVFAVGTLAAFHDAGSVPSPGLPLGAGDSVDCTFDMTLPTTTQAHTPTSRRTRRSPGR